MNKDYFTNKMTYSEWNYHEKIEKSLEYTGAKSFRGSYEEIGGKNYSFSVSKFSKGSYSMSA